MKSELFIPAKSLLLSEFPIWEYHVHTQHTDGVNTVDEIVSSAIEKNIERIIFTEHTEPWQAKTTDWFGKYCEEIELAQQSFGHQIEIVIGIEAPAIDFNGSLEMTGEMAQHANFILGAAHRYPGMEGRKVSELSPSEALDLEYKTLLSLCGSKKVDAIAHIGATCMKYCGPFPLDMTHEIVREATKNGKAIEINHAYHKPLDDYLNICIEEDAFIIPGSNAHKKEDIGNVAYAIRQWQLERE